MFRYVSNNGDTIEFSGESPFYANPDSLRSYEVGYNLVRNTVTRFTREAAKVDFPITIFADTEREGAQLLDRLQQAFDHDVRMHAAGRLELDSYHTSAFVTTLGFESDDSSGLFEIEVSTELLVPKPVWILEETHSYSPSRESMELDGLDYPYDFDFDFYGGSTSGSITNPLSWPCDVRIVIYGAASNPYIYIGDNRYEVDVEVPEGGLLIIDGLDKSKIELRNQYGESTNVFERRIDGTQGSGTYVFEKIKAGVNPVSWDGSFPFDIVICGERSWPPCTT